ncbi:PA14 domain-containing protein [Streptomyces mirabilis]|uniref:PA14 domain-containing protein n=1 Tax=Streptomyces mirabilis TaxID=68239 RepID=UPI0021BF876D|nr:PA14 domain-containing protein [Streptomyces mirabilis]MCT9109173.1 PA14 domain-containing protein [Streptomyces mirabilis]
MRPVGRSGPALAATLTIATTGGLLAVSGAPASAASSCASPVYKRQFYANTTFSGTPKKTDCDAAVSENWGTKAPASGLPKDNFGVRWTVTRDFGSGGPFALPVTAQDGLRVDYANWTSAANVSFVYNPRTSASVDKVRPLAPVGSTDKLSYLDISAVESVAYYYRVTVLDAAGNESARSVAAAG